MISELKLTSIENIQNETERFFLGGGGAKESSIMAQVGFVTILVILLTFHIFEILTFQKKWLCNNPVIYGSILSSLTCKLESKNERGHRKNIWKTITQMVPKFMKTVKNKQTNHMIKEAQRIQTGEHTHT